jgi:hypothetical protein
MTEPDHREILLSDKFLKNLAQKQGMSNEPVEEGDLSQRRLG